MKTYRYRLTKMKRLRPNSSSWSVVRGAGKQGAGTYETILEMAEKYGGAAMFTALKRQLEGTTRHGAASSGVVEPGSVTRPADMTGWRLTWHHDSRDDGVAEVIRQARGAVRTARTSKDIWAEETARSNALAAARHADEQADRPVASRIAKRILSEIPVRQQSLFGAPRANPRSTTNVQTLLFDKGSFTPASARSWASQHGYHAIKVDKGTKTATKLRIRQHAPAGFIRGSFRTVEFGKGVSAVVGRPRKHVVRNPSALPGAQGLFVNPSTAMRYAVGPSMLRMYVSSSPECSRKEQAFEFGTGYGTPQYVLAPKSETVDTVRQVLHGNGYPGVYVRRA